jgi:hypothetical protein
VAQHTPARITGRMVMEALTRSANADDDIIHEVLSGPAPACKPKPVRGAHRGPHVHYWLTAKGGRLGAVSVKRICNQVASLSQQARRQHRPEKKR